jgi:hypothetical protein
VAGSLVILGLFAAFLLLSAAALAWGADSRVVRRDERGR